MKSKILILILLLSSFYSAIAQKLTVSDDYLTISAEADDPLYTTYAASIDRSRLYGDKAYKMVYYEEDEPLYYESDQAGRIFNIWMINKLVIDKTRKFHKEPLVIASFPDMAILEYEPFKGISVRECFFVYSSQIALVSMQVKNNTNKEQLVEVFPVYELGNDSLEIKYYNPRQEGYVLNHFETRKRLISDLYSKGNYPDHCRDFFTANFTPYSWGGFNGDLVDFYNYIKTDFYSESREQDSLNMVDSGYVDFIALHNKYILKPGDEINVRYIRGFQDTDLDLLELMAFATKMKEEPLQQYIDDNVELYRSVPRIDFRTEDEKLVYLGAFNLVRSCMLPPYKKTSHNYYVFSRNPKWGWGHGHQVLHESLSMMAYAYLDSQSAQGSQRVFIEQQGDDGLIAYRHGPRGMQDYPHKGMPTTSAPFFSWINYEVFKVSRDTVFLKDAYKSGKKYVKWLVEHRDTDEDGTFEWGPYGIIENVRDWYNAVFQVSAERYLDVDKEDISDELECLDLSLMIVNEMRSLSNMALEMGLTEEAKKWQSEADEIAELINERMWDQESGFYYHVDKVNHEFRFMTRDLKRQEIIGFLPMWAGVASKKQAKRLVHALTDTTKFWREYGIPTLAADDPWYTPYVDYCCKWNGPVWLLWDYMVFDGLKKYGYDKLAYEVGQKMLKAVTVQLSKNHNYWESYSPDNTVLDCPPNYIWDSIMAKVLIDMYLHEPK